MKYSNTSYRFSKIRIAMLGLILTLVIAPSCIGDYTASLPDEYHWNPDLAFPIGETEFGLGLGKGFDTLLLQLDTLDNPIWESLGSIPFSGNIDFNLEELFAQLEWIDSLQLRVNTHNGFPVGFNVQAYLLDGSANVIDSLFDPILALEEGTLGTDGMTEAFGTTQTDIIFDKERIGLLKETREIYFEGTIINVINFPDFYFEVQLSAIVGVAADITL